MQYKVFIPCAGSDKQLTEINPYINRALVTIVDKPVLSHIVEKFPPTTKFVIALGHKGNMIQDFLTLAYPTYSFTFVTIDPYEGEGSGLGLTMLDCEKELQCPFIFCSNDTLVTGEIPPPNSNWMGYAINGDTSQYRSLRIKHENVTEICSKGALGEVKPYIGLAGIHDYKLFWRMMKSSPEAVTIGESFGLQFLIEKGIKSKAFVWHDTGNPLALEKTRAAFHDTDSPNILHKETEAIWFVADKVIKFSLDEAFIEKRVKKAPLLAPFVPPITNATTNFYVYKKVPGTIFSAKPRSDTFVYLLEWLKNFWQKQALSKKEHATFKKTCQDFYKVKTLARVSDFFSRFEQIDTQETINGVAIPKISNILEKIDWSWICTGIPVRWHGDLHFENILINDNGHQPFTLLDWRQGFGDILGHGDIYYDLGKLNHGLIISHELIHRELFKVNRKVNQIEFDFLRKQALVECEQTLKAFVETEGYDYPKVQAMTYLIFLNIAPLHHYPYSLLLFYLGKSGLYRLLQENQQP